MRLRAPLRLAAFAASFALLTVSSVARAQTPPDLVKTKDGSMYRGTISELVAHDHVDLVLANGQTRRFAIADVTFAGPTPAAVPPPGAAPPPISAAPPGPPPPPPPGAPNGPHAEVRLDVDPPDLQFQLRTGTSQIEGVGWGGRHSYAFMGTEASYEPLCTAPCTAQLPIGPQHIGLSRNGGLVLEPDQPVVITGSGTLHGAYTSHLGIRVAGLLIDLAAVATGTVLVLTSFHQAQACDATTECSNQGHIDGARVGAGFGIMLGGAILGTVLMLQHDTVDLSFVPMSPVATSGSKELAALRTSGTQPQGMSLQLRF